MKKRDPMLWAALFVLYGAIGWFCWVVYAH